MKRSVLLFLLALLTAASYAVITDYYSFTNTTSAYMEISGTAIPAAQVDEGISTGISIGFDFMYGTGVYNQVKVSSNGYITLGTTPGNVASNVIGSLTTCPIVAGLWDDLHCGRVTGGSYPVTSSVQYALGGTAGNRSFIVQYKNAYWNYTSTTSTVNFQIILYENKTIEIRYGNHTGVTPTSPSASIGINMKPGGVNNYLSVNPLTALASSTTETNNINNFVIANTMYVFSPINDLDLTVDSVTGINTPETGVSTPYTVTVRNIGIFPPNEYVIKLMNGATELASVAGVAVAPGNSHSAVLHFAPIDAGDMILTGLVVVDGETVTNNNSASKRIVAMVPGTSQQTVGTGGTNSFNMPINVYYRNSLCETIYTAAELTGVGRITDIAFYSNFANAQTRPVKIWLGTTTQPDLSAGWISSNQLIQVFDGSLPFIAGADTMIIHLQTPFTYNSGNLVMLVQRVFEPTMGSSSDVFSCQIIGANKTRYVQSDATVYDPASPSGGTLTGLCPKTTFYHTLPEVLPVCSVSPESHNFGQAVLNFQNIQPITVMNSGGSDLIINSILANGGTHFSLQNCPALPVTLATGASFNFDAVFSPQSPGPLSGNIAIYNNTLDSPKYVNLTGFGVDATIYSLPHTENFDTATVPALPLTWSKIATTPASVVSSTSLPYSTPNCINMNNSTNITNPLILVLPPLSASFPITEIRVKFRAKASTAGMVVGIGVLNNPASSGTFNQVSSVNLTTTWMQYSVSLRSYVGGGNYIGFKHDLSGNYRSIYIDDVVLEEMLFNDLAAKSVSGDATPDIGVSNDYVLSIYNPGIYTQSGYSVKLVDSNGTELAATIGPDVVHEATVQAIVSWTPTTAGNTTIYTKIVMPGDENTSNDLSPGFPIAVQPVNSLQLTVGDGSQTSYNAPVNMYYKNSLYENIYYASELTSFGLINAVSFYNNFATNGLVDKPTRIWMGMTSLPDLSSGWIPSTSLSLVFDGNVTYPAGQNTITIPLQTEFNYLQDNLVLLVQRPIDTQFFSSSDLFYCQTVGTNRARRLQSDTIVYDPASPATGTLTGQFPKTTFNLLPPAQFSITPGDYDFGMVSLEAPEAIEYTIRNTGGQELIISVLEMQEISSGHHFSIQNPPPLPCIINGGDSLQFNVVFSPEQEGISYSENLYIEDTTHPQGIEYLLEGSGVYNGPEISAIPNPILAEVIEDGAVDAFSLLYNEGAAPLNFNLISSLPPFLEVFPESGAISPGDSLQLIISIDAAGLLEGVVSYGINFSTNDYYNPTYQLDINITVTPREMNANFTGQPLTGHAPLNVNFTDITHYGPQIPGHTSIAWFWDFDNDGVDDSFVQNPSHIYPTPGVYSVKLSVVSNIGMISTEIKELYVTATNEPPILTAPPDIIYMTEDTEYGPISIPGWFFDPDSDPLTFTVSPNPRITHRFAGTNLYLTPDPTNWTGITTIVITATDPFNASVSKLVTITVSNQNDPPSFTPRTWSLVTGSTLAVNFADYITDPDTPSSQISIQVFNTEVIPHVFLSYSPNVPGVLNGTFYASTGFSGTETFNIIINDHVSRSITLSNFDVQVLSTLTADPQINITTGYTGQAISFSDQTTGNPNQWLWNFGNGVTSTQQNPTYSYTSPGIYNVQLTVTNTQAGITSNASPPVQVNMVGILPASCDITTTQSWAQALGQDQYNVFHNLNISPGSTLSIASGIKVNIFDSTSVNIAGAVSANNVIFRPQAGLTKWQGLKFLTSGQSSSLSNSTIYNAVNPILISSDNVQLNNVSICLTDTSMVMPGSGVTITGSNSPTLNEVGISNYKTGITVIGAPLRRASTPTLTNIRVRNSTDSSREEEPTIGIEILGEVSAQIENVEVINYDIGILFDNSSSQNYSAPTLDNVLIQNEPQSRQGITGLEIIGSVRAEIDELEIERFETGIIYQDYASTGTPTPTLTNIRVRNSTDSSRSESVGLFLDNAVKIQISNTDIDSFDTGIRIKSSNSGAQSTPTLTNIRVRNSTDSSRGNIAGIDLIGYVSPQFSNILVDKYNLGIIWSGTEEALNTTPTLTNIRVRNSTDSSRPESRGVVIKDVLEFTASNDTIEFYSLGLEITKTSGTNNSTPTLTNIRVRNSTDSSRLDHTGVFLGEYVAGTMSECMIENYKTGIFMANGNQTVLTYNYIKNCGIGIKASGYEKEPPPLTRNIIKVESSWVAAHPNWTYTAFDLANEGPWDIRNSIILGYSTCLTAADADINFRNNIVYATFDITAPFNLTNSDLSYTYNDINTSGSFPQGSHNFNSNPLFDTENIHHLTYNSPCIDAGDPECDEDEDGTVIDVGVYPYLHKADFTPKSSVITYGDIINFSNQTIGHDHPSTSYIWDLNNDSSPDGVTKNWSHQFNDVGYFSLKLTVTTGNLADSILVENAIFVNDNKLKTVESMQVGLDGDDVVLTWEPIVETLRGLAIEVDYYLIYTASDPYGTFDLLDCIIDGDTTFIHTNGSTEGSGFYLVIGLAGTQQEFEDFRDSHPTYPFNRNLLPFKQRR